MLADLDPATWGTAAQWFSVILSGMALFIAVTVPFRNRAEEKRSQAIKVVAYPLGFKHSATRRPDNSVVTTAVAEIVIRNGGDQPIYEASFSVVNDDGSEFGSSPVWGIIEADSVGESHELEIPHYLSQSKSMRPHLDLRFTDSFGQRWLRTHEGKLRKIKPDR